MADSVPEWVSWMTPEQYELFVGLAQSALERRGISATYHDGTFTLDNGMYYSLDSISRQIRALDQRAWPKAISDHVGSLLTYQETSTAEPSQVFLSCEYRDNLVGAVDDQIHDVLPGIALLPCIDHPNYVEKHWNETEASQAFGGLSAMIELGAKNLSRVKFETETINTDPQHDDAIVVAITADDPYVAGRLGVLDSIIPRNHWGNAGLIVAVPHQQVILVHTLHGVGMVSAGNAMLRYAQAQYRSAPHVISPHLYFMGIDGATQQITRPIDSGGLGIFVEGAFEQAMLKIGMIK